MGERLPWPLRARERESRSETFILPEAESVVTAIKNVGGEASSLGVDVSKAADAENMVGHAVRQYGRLDFAFNNAGFVGSARVSSKQAKRIICRHSAARVTREGRSKRRPPR